MDISIRITLGSLLLFLSTPALSHIESGDYLLLYDRNRNCGEVTYLVDYARVLENGEAEFLNGIRLIARDMDPEGVAAYVAQKIAKHKPKSISVQVVASVDEKIITLIKLRSLLTKFVCDRQGRQWVAPNRRLASMFPPNKRLW